MKSHRGAWEKIQEDKTGKIKRMKAFKSHILTKKTAKRKRNLRKAALIFKGEAKKLAQIIAN